MDEEDVFIYISRKRGHECSERKCMGGVGGRKWKGANDALIFI